MKWPAWISSTRTDAPGLPGAAVALLATTGLVQEPDPAFAFVDPVLQHARRRNVAMLVAEIMGLAHCSNQPLVVFAQLGQHVLRRDVVGVVVGDALDAIDLADRAQRTAADLAGALGDVIGHGEDLLGLLIEQQVIVAKMRTGHMPVKV